MGDVLLEGFSSVLVYLSNKGMFLQTTLRTIFVLLCVCVLVICVLVFTMFVLFVLSFCIVSFMYIICFVCTSVRTTATE